MFVDIDIIQSRLIIILWQNLTVPLNELLYRNLGDMRFVLVGEEHEWENTGPNLDPGIFFQVVYHRVHQKLCLFLLRHLVLYYEGINLVEKDEDAVKVKPPLRLIVWVLSLMHIQ